MTLSKIIFDIKVSKEPLRSIENLVGPGASKIVGSHLVDIANKKAKSAESALKSYVPRDTEELRNEFISYEPASTRSYRATAGIIQGTHYGRDNKPRGSAWLANILQSGGITGRDHRTKVSRALSSYGSIPSGSPVAGWITIAIKDWKQLNG